ncbi:MAG: prepilin-type N-terminal cleavage/methylation domain-containing protein [Rhodocyclaceae bacterium]|nr:prepilin-type N-terminal cleavage/methylation domain-containing protein [Rhodocyclaceae bacterium]MBX3670496.1 prepilin-type N-terminal cleavage/methylation domain-containing protein [Rhodocyclaceae bacterium]
MISKQGGFTLIELIVVIIILGVLAAAAVPKFVDLSTDARNSAASGVAAAIASGSTMNYAGRKAGKATAVAVTDANVCSAATLGNFLNGGSVTLADSSSPPATPTDKDFLVSGTGACNGANADGTTVSCNITAARGSGNSAQAAVVVCAS